MNPLMFIQQARIMLMLASRKQWSRTYVELRMKFAREYNLGYIFSTRFGAYFFDEVEQYLLNRNFIQAEKGQQLGEYDKNFNDWLKQVRK